MDSIGGKGGVEEYVEFISLDMDKNADKWKKIVDKMKIAFNSFDPQDFISFFEGM